MVGTGTQFASRILPYSLVGFGALLMAFRFRSLNQVFARRWIITMLISGAIWAFAKMMQFISPTLDTKLLFENLQWFGIAIFPPAFVFFSLELSNRKKKKEHLFLFLLVLIPAFIITVVFTNSSHHLFAVSYSLVQNETSSYLVVEHSVLYWAFINYTCFLISFGVINLAGFALQPKGIIRLRGIIQDLKSFRRSTHNALAASKNEYQGLFENAHDAIIISNLQTGQILDANARASRMFGYSNREFKEIKLETIVEDKEKLTNVLGKIKNTNTHTIFELSQYRKNVCPPISTEVNAGIVIFNGKPAIQSIHRDITLRKNMEAQLLHASLHDTLTDLPNRALFLDRLNRAITHGNRSKEYHFAVLYLDLDRFKNINDTLGHIAGDKCLVEIAKKLQSVLRESDTVARIGGDEFALILEDVGSEEILGNLCNRILEGINSKLKVDNNEFSVSASIGVVMGNALYKNPEEYLKDADIAMYKAKELGKARFEIFDISMRTSIYNRMKIENLLCIACFENEFSVFYQPIYDLKINNLIGFEALLRWRQPKVGLISPEEFIPIAENLGVIHGIGSWVLDKTCTQLRLWMPYIEKIPNFKMNVNISAVQLLRRDFPDELNAFLAREQVDPRFLALEITETAFINNSVLASEQVAKLKSIGVDIQLDDFGTGYSSLSFINLFQVDALKIERQFIGTLNHGRQADLVRAIIALGENMGLEIIAEGIETEEQLNFLIDGGCHLGQGFYFSQAVVAREAQKLLASFVTKIETQNLSPTPVSMS